MDKITAAKMMAAALAMDTPLQQMSECLDSLPEGDEREALKLKIGDFFSMSTYFIFEIARQYPELDPNDEQRLEWLEKAPANKEELARHVGIRAFRSSSELTALLPTIKSLLPEEEYEAYAKRLASAAYAIYAEVLQKIFTDFPSIEKEFEKTIRQTGKI